MATTSPATNTNETGQTFVNSEEGDGDNAVSDVHTLSSSPRATTLHLSPVQSLTPAWPGVDPDLTTSMTPYMHEQRTSAVRASVPLTARYMTVLTDRDTSRDLHGLWSNVPGSIQLFKRLFKRSFTGVYRKVQRKMTMSYKSTSEASRSKWLNFELDVGRNSNFYTETLTNRQLEIIGGAEYRALRVLSYLVPTVRASAHIRGVFLTSIQYFVVTQIITYLIFAPWLSISSRYDNVFEAQPRLVKKPWYGNVRKLPSVFMRIFLGSRSSKLWPPTPGVVYP